MPEDEPVSRPPPRHALYRARCSLSYKDEVRAPHGEERAEAARLRTTLRSRRVNHAGRALPHVLPRG